MMLSEKQEQSFQKKRFEVCLDLGESGLSWGDVTFA